MTHLRLSRAGRLKMVTLLAKTARLRSLLRDGQEQFDHKLFPDA